jgi:hypothetical protein
MHCTCSLNFIEYISICLRKYVLSKNEGGLYWKFIQQHVSSNNGWIRHCLRNKNGCKKPLANKEKNLFLALCFLICIIWLNSHTDSKKVSIILILQVSKLQFREVRSFLQCHSIQMAEKGFKPMFIFKAWSYSFLSATTRRNYYNVMSGIIEICVPSLPTIHMYWNVTFYAINTCTY